MPVQPRRSPATWHEQSRTARYSLFRLSARKATIRAATGARLTLSGGVTADFDSPPEGPQTWDIEVETPAGPPALRMGGHVLELDGVPVSGEASIMGEYPALYARMAALVRAAREEAVHLKRAPWRLANSRVLVSLLLRLSSRSLSEQDCRRQSF